MGYRIVLTIALILLGLSVTGCSDEMRKEPAFELAERFYSALDGEDYQTLLSLIHPELFGDSSAEQFVESLKIRRSKYGGIKRYRIVTWDIWKEQRMGHSGVYYKLWYLVTYNKGTLMENFVMFRPITTQKILIYQYSWSDQHRIDRNR